MSLSMRVPRPLLFAFCLALVLGACAQTATPEPKVVKPASTTQETDGAIGLLAPGEPLTGVPVEKDDARQGEADASVTVVAFLDFECGFCREGFQTLLALRASYTGKDVRIVFKHLPLRSHPNSLGAAIAGQAVTELGGSDAFFRFAQAAFENSHDLSYENLARWASDAGVPAELYNERVGDEVTLRRVAQDAGLAHQVGVDSTPTFFVNGRLVSGAQSIEVFHQAIQNELKAMSAAQGSSWRTRYQGRVSTNMKASLVTALVAENPSDFLVPVGNSPVFGSSEAPVTVVMFTDFECPFCKRADETIQALQKKYGNALRVVFKHLPLPFHQSARPAALVAEAVHQKSGSRAFFDASGEIFATSPNLGLHELTLIGQKHGLTEKEVKDAVEEHNLLLNDRLEEDRILADDVLARGTPHFFINGKRLSGARPRGHFEALIEYELERARSTLSTGGSKADVYETLQKGAISPGAPQKLSGELPENGQPTRGKPNARIRVHVFSDFECPYCKLGEENLALLAKEYPDDLLFVWHDLPLPFHERALPAARAARYAYKKLGNNGFWQMHAALFNLNSDSIAISDEEILEHGNRLGLNADELMKSISDESTDSGIERDIALAESLDINGTPAYVIGGYIVTGARPLNHLVRVVKLALADVAPSKEKPHSRAPR
jgi:protein-disulfide isomerase